MNANLPRMLFVRLAAKKSFTLVLVIGLIEERHIVKTDQIRRLADVDFARVQKGLHGGNTNKVSIGDRTGARVFFKQFSKIRFAHRTQLGVIGDFFVFEILLFQI